VIPMISDMVTAKSAMAAMGVMFVLGAAMGATVATPGAPPDVPRAEMCKPEYETIAACNEHRDKLRDELYQTAATLTACKMRVPECGNQIEAALEEQARLRCAICKRAK
jgi:hypothetical protein